MFIETLKKIVSTPQTHAKWLNTLSYLEHVGSRKIIKSQDSTMLNIATLQHLAEETRHALFFRKLSLKISPGQCSSYEDKHLICPRGSKDYFQSLDNNIEKILAVDFDEKTLLVICYLYVSHTIETRAMKLFQSYADILETQNSPISINTIIQDERGHLEAMLDGIEAYDPSPQTRIARCLEAEKALFLTFSRAIALELDQSLTMSTVHANQS